MSNSTATKQKRNKAPGLGKVRGTPMNERSVMAQEFHKARTELGLSMLTVGVETGLVVSEVCSFENDKYVFDKNRKIKILCEYYGVDINEVLQ